MAKVLWTQKQDDQRPAGTMRSRSTRPEAERFSSVASPRCPPARMWKRR